MKKLLVFALFVAGGTILSAQTLTSQSMSTTPVPMVVQKMLEVEKAPLNGTPTLVSSMYSPAEVSAKAALKAHYWKPSGTLYASLDFIEANYYATLIVGAAFTDWVFKNASTGADRYEWTLNDNAMDADGDNNGVAKYGICKESSEGFAGFYMPQLTAFSGASTSTYTYGADVPNGRPMIMSGLSSHLLSSFDPSYIDSNTKIYLSSPEGYAFGTGDHYEGEKADCIAVMYEKPQAPLYIKGVSILAGSDGTIMPSNGTLTVKIIEVKEGKLTSNVLGEAVMHAEDMEDSKFLQDSKVLPFRFTEYDPETGLTSEAGVTVNTEYAIVVFGFNEPGFDIGFPVLDKESMAYFEPAASYVVVGDKYYRYANPDKVLIYDLFVNLDAMYNCLYVIPETNNLRVPDAGGEAVDTEGVVGTLVYSTMQMALDDTSEGGVWVESLSDWLSIAGVDDSQYEEYRAYGVVLSGEPLPENNRGRWGELVLASHGAKCTIRVSQGPDAITSATVSNVKAIRNGDNFELSYDADMTSVQVMNAAGQLIASYDLNNGGTFVMPAANLANGLYILKFNGERTATVKVMK